MHRLELHKQLQQLQIVQRLSSGMLESGLLPLFMSMRSVSPTVNSRSLDLLMIKSMRSSSSRSKVQSAHYTATLESVMQALSTAIEEFPIVNSSLNSKADALLQHSSHNIGVAMATPSGLVVPNIKNVQQRNVASIAAELARLQKDAAIGRVNQADVTGGTISISNIGTVLCFVLCTHQQEGCDDMLCASSALGWVLNYCVIHVALHSLRMMLGHCCG